MDSEGDRQCPDPLKFWPIALKKEEKIIAALLFSGNDNNRQTDVGKVYSKHLFHPPPINYMFLILYMNTVLHDALRKEGKKSSKSWLWRTLQELLSPTMKVVIPPMWSLRLIQTYHTSQAIFSGENRS